MQKVVVAIIHYKKGYIFHLRKKSPYIGMIGLVGGKVEKNETTDQTIIREIKEETGLTVNQIKLQGVVKDCVIEKNKNMVNYLFVYVVNCSGKIKENSEEGKIITITNLDEIKKIKNKFIPLDFNIFMKYRNNNLYYHEMITKIKINNLIFNERLFKPKKCVLIGSFRKHINIVNKISKFFSTNDVEVLSPKNCNVINPGSNFVLFDYDPPILNEGEIQTIVLKKMHISNFVYLINPDGYLGKSAALEIGYAFANNIKVFSLTKINDMHHHFITEVLSPEEIVRNWNKVINTINCRKTF